MTAASWEVAAGLSLVVAALILIAHYTDRR